MGSEAKLYSEYISLSSRPGARGGQVRHSSLKPSRSPELVAALSGEVVVEGADRINDGPGLQALDTVSQRAVEPLRPYGERGHQLVVGASAGQLRRTDRHGHEDGVGVTVRRGGEPMNIVDVEPTFAGLEPLIGPERGGHGAGDVGGGHAPVTADQLQRLRKKDAVPPGLYDAAVHPTGLFGVIA
jgi:hypothetical protein